MSRFPGAALIPLPPVPPDLLPAPVLDDDLNWQHPENRHLMREAYDIDRDAIFRDFYLRLETATPAARRPVPG